MLPFLRFTENNIPLLLFNQRFLNSIKIADSKWLRQVERLSAPEMLEKIIGSKRLSCNAGHQEFGRCCTRGESEGWDQRQGIHPGFEIQGKHHQRSKTERPHNKDLCSPNIK